MQLIRSTLAACLLGVVAAALAAGPPARGAEAGGAEAGGFRRLGYMEQAWVREGGMVLDAKLDTGADLSSLHAPSWREIGRKGTSRIRFTPPGGQGIPLERPLVRWVAVQGERGLRPVVHLTLCVGDRSATVEVTLADRAGLRCPLLVGRNFLSRNILVDGAAAFTRPLACPGW